MSDQNSDTIGITVESLPNVFRYYKEQLEKVPPNIYPLDLIAEAVNTLSFATTKESLRSLVIREEFGKLYAVMMSVMNKKPDIKKLKQRGFTDEELERINIYKELVNDLSQEVDQIRSDSEASSGSLRD